MCNLNKLMTSLVVGASLCGSQGASAALGTMGYGTPQFSMYAHSLGEMVVVKAFANQVYGFPVGCVSLTITPQTMGADSYKLAIATMLTARVTGQKVMFYAHEVRDWGCGVDYLELTD